MKTTTILFLFLFFGLKSSAQIGGFAQCGTESFYIKNLTAAAGIKYKEFRLGAYYQSANNNGERFVRHGLMAEAGLLNVDKICYLSVGFRVLNTGFIPHATIAFRFKRYEIPLTFSSYSHWLTGNFGLRVFF